MFDVLGFEERLRQSGLDAVLAGYEQLRRTVTQAEVVAVFSPSVSAYHRTGSIVVSDTILLWCNDDWNAVQTLISASAHLMSDAIDLGWPLRGAIAYGRCVLDRDSDTYVGLPIVDVARTEKCQAWVGAALHQSVLDHPIFGSPIRALEDVIEYSVPVKSRCPVLTHALHWCAYSGRARAALEEARDRIQEADVREYYSRTLAYVLDRCAGYWAAHDPASDRA